MGSLKKRGTRSGEMARGRKPKKVKQHNDLPQALAIIGRESRQMPLQSLLRMHDLKEPWGDESEDDMKSTTTLDPSPVLKYLPSDSMHQVMHDTSPPRPHDLFLEDMKLLKTPPSDSGCIGFKLLLTNDVHSHKPTRKAARGGHYTVVRPVKKNAPNTAFMSPVPNKPGLDRQQNSSTPNIDVTSTSPEGLSTPNILRAASRSEVFSPVAISAACNLLNLSGGIVQHVTPSKFVSRVRRNKDTVKPLIGKRSSNSVVGGGKRTMRNSSKQLTFETEVPSAFSAPNPRPVTV